LNDNGIRVTVPIINNKGKYVSFEEFSSEDSKTRATYAVRLLKFIPGKLLYDIPYTPSILRECGALLAKVVNALQVRNLS
jgi:Ser/Thr protein kinase RdoA (MazF antagonist)